MYIQISRKTLGSSFKKFYSSSLFFVKLIIKNSLFYNLKKISLWSVEVLET